MPRNQAPHFKVHCSIENHEKTIGAFQDDRCLAAYVRLGILAVERYADRTDDSFLATEHDLRRAFNVRSTQAALKRAAILAEKCPVRVTKTEKAYRVQFPNFSKKQFFRREDGPRRGPPATTAATATTTAEPTPSSPPSATDPPPIGEPARPPAKRAARARPVKRKPPEDLTDDQARALFRWATEKEPWAVGNVVDGKAVDLRALVDACLGHFSAGSPRNWKADYYQACQNWIRKERNERRPHYQTITGQTEGPNREIGRVAQRSEALEATAQAAARLVEEDRRARGTADRPDDRGGTKHIPRGGASR